MTISSDSSTRYLRAPNAIQCDIETGIALLDTESDTYFLLNKTGSLIWQSLEHGSSVRQLSLELSEKFSISLDRCLPDIVALMQQLLDRSLILESANEEAV